MSFSDENKTKRLFQELSFYNTFIVKPKIRKLKRILQELSFYDELRIYEMSKAFGQYGRSYKVETVDTKDPLAQLEGSIKDLFKNLLDKIKDFKYQIKVKPLLRKDKEHGKIEFPPV